MNNSILCRLMVTILLSFVTSFLPLSLSFLPSLLPPPLFILPFLLLPLSPSPPSLFCSLSFSFSHLIPDLHPSLLSLTLSSSCLPGTDSKLGRFHSKVWDMGHSRTGAVSQPNAHVLSRSTSSDCRLWHYKYGMFQMLGYHSDRISTHSNLLWKSGLPCDCSQCNHDNQHVVIVCDIYISFCDPIIM